MPAQHMTPAFGSNQITIDVAGDYAVDLQMSFSGANSSTYNGTIYINAVPTSIEFTRKLGVGGDVGSASCHGIITCAATDVISAYIEGDATTLTVANAVLSAAMI